MEKNIFEQAMHWLLNIRPIAAIAVAGVLITSVVAFFKSVGEGYDMLFKKPSTTQINASYLKSEAYSKKPIPEEGERWVLHFNDSLKVKGTVDLFTLVKDLSEDLDGGPSSWLAQANNPNITWGTEGLYHEKKGVNLPESSCGPVSRSGYCVLSKEGKPVYNELKNRKKSGLWQISYCGSDNGVEHVFISSLVTDELVDSEYDESNVKDKNRITLIKPVTNDLYHGIVKSTFKDKVDLTEINEGGRTDNIYEFYLSNKKIRIDEQAIIRQNKTIAEIIIDIKILN